MIARRRPVRAGRRWPARRTSNHARTSQVDRATDDPIMRAATPYWAPFQIHGDRRIRRGPRTRRQLRSVSGAAADIVLTPQTRHRPGLVRVTVMLIERCRSVLTERCRKIAR
jgi:hypothetical protein